MGAREAKAVLILLLPTQKLVITAIVMSGNTQGASRREFEREQKKGQEGWQNANKPLVGPRQARYANAMVAGPCRADEMCRSQQRRAHERGTGAEDVQHMASLGLAALQ